jgi:hypothetical protein
MSFEVTLEPIKVKIYGQEIDLSKPKFKHVKKFIEDQKSDEFKGKEFDLMKNFMIEIGLPKDLADEMAIDDFRALTEYVMGHTKKNLAGGTTGQQN